MKTNEQESSLDLAPATDEVTDEETEKFLAWLFGPTQGEDESMTQDEAKNLLDYIQLGRKPGVAWLRQIANGEYIVVLKKRCWHCWCPADWVRFQEIESKKSKKEVQV